MYSTHFVERGKWMNNFLFSFLLYIFKEIFFLHLNNKNCVLNASHERRYRKEPTRKITNACTVSTVTGNHNLNKKEKK